MTKKKTTKKTAEKAVHPLAPLLVECFTLANAFEALAGDARIDAWEAQRELEYLNASVGFLRIGREECDDPARELTPPGWHDQDARLDAAKNVIAQCESLVDTLRQAPLSIRNMLDALVKLNALVNNAGDAAGSL